MAELTHVSTVIPERPHGTLIEDEDRAPLPSLMEMARTAEQMAAEGRLTRESVAIETPAEMPPTITAPKAPWIPERFQGESFATYKPHTDSQAAAASAVRQWVVRTLEGRGDMLALIGSTGAGKSHLLYAAGRALIEAKQKVYARPWYLLADELRWGGRSPFNEDMKLEEGKDVRDLLWRAKIVLIDEVRPTAGTAFDDTELAKLACHCYDRKIAVLITTNVTPLGDVIGPAAASRFTQVTIVGPDQRQPKPQLARSA